MEYKLCKTWVKLDKTKPQTVGVPFSAEETTNIVLPYSNFISTQEGVLDTQLDKTDVTYKRTYVVDTEENARKLFKTLTDDSIPEIKKMSDLIKSYLGDTDYEVTWSLRKVYQK